MSRVLKQWLFVAILVTTRMSVNSSYRILGIFPYNSKSHHIVFEALMKGLAKNGHQVDVISHYPLEKPLKNYKDIVSLVGTGRQHTNNVTLDAARKAAYDVTRIIAVENGNELCDLLGLQEIQKLVKNPPNDPPHDLVITEAYGAHCFMGFGYLLKVPVVAVSSGVDYPWINYFIGNNDNLAYASNVLLGTGSSPMDFRQRLLNVITHYYELLKFHRLTYESQTQLMRRYLHPDIPNIRQIERNVALTLINNHPISSGVKPITPAFVQIAGINMETNDESLPSDLQIWMDKSSYGVVYFSLGSKILLESFPEYLLKQIYASFAKIFPVNVLLKIVNCSQLPAGLPKNVKYMPWIPQQSVLAHPNTKVFINHGGLGSIQEALYYGIPMIGIPLFSDQFRNVDYLVAKQMMIKIDIDRLSETSLDSALQILLYDSIYKQKAMYYSKLFRDRPISPMNNAIFWIEYIMRNGPDALRSPALRLSQMQLALLDVYGALLLILALFTFIVFLFIKILIKIAKKKFYSSPSKMKGH